MKSCCLAITRPPILMGLSGANLQFRRLRIFFQMYSRVLDRVLSNLGPSFENRFKLHEVLFFFFRVFFLTSEPLTQAELQGSFPFLSACRSHWFGPSASQIPSLRLLIHSPWWRHQCKPTNSGLQSSAIFKYEQPQRLLKMGIPSRHHGFQY